MMSSLLYNLNNTHSTSTQLIEYMTPLLVKAELFSPEANSIGAGVVDVVDSLLDDSSLDDSSLEGAVTVAKCGGGNKHVGT